MFHNGDNTRSQCLSVCEQLASPFSRIPFLFMLLSTHHTVLSSFILNPSLHQNVPLTPSPQQSGSCYLHKQITSPAECPWHMLPASADTAHHTNLFHSPNLIASPWRQEPCFTSILQS